MGHVENIKNLRGNLRRLREVRRKRLTRRERILGWSLALGPGVLVAVAVCLLVFDHARIVGVALLVVSLVVYSVPVGPLVRAKVRRREARAARK